MKTSKVLIFCLMLALILCFAAGCASPDTAEPATGNEAAANTENQTNTQPPSDSAATEGETTADDELIPYPETINLAFATGGSGGTYYVVGSGMASLAEKYLNVRMMVQTSSSSTENGRLLANKEVDFAICRPDGTYYSMVAEREFADEEPLTNLRAVMLGHASSVQCVALKKSGIDDWEDLRGKRIALAPQSSPAVYIARSTLEVNGLKEGDYKEAYLTLAETAEALKNGSIDAGFFISAAPTSAVLDLTSTSECVFLNMTEQRVDELCGVYPFGFKGYLPAGTYEGQDEDIWMIRDPAILMTREDVDEELVYNIIKLITTHVDELAEIHPSGAEWDLETAVDGLGEIPLHPGAEKYLKEKGII